MRCPKINELPSLSHGKKGWPWTEEIPQVPETIKDGYLWPRVSIVTPSFNQSQFLEETIRSVLLQGYPNLEYIVIDGRSTDNSLDIIKKYEPWLSGWVSESDNGQSHAINKGLMRSTGTYWAWLNSDDIYMPGTILRAVKSLQMNPNVAVVYGDGLWINEDSVPLHIYRSGPLDARALLTGESGHGIPQATSFMRRETVGRVGGVNENLKMAMDFELWIKLSLNYDLLYIEDTPLAGIRSHANMKTRNFQLQGYLEDLRILKEYLAHPLCPEGVSLSRNLQYISVNILIAKYYIENKLPLNAIFYLLKALNADYFYTSKRILKYMSQLQKS